MNNLIKKFVMPMIFVTTFPFATVYLAYLGKSSSAITRGFFGNSNSWLLISIFTSWAILFLKIPSKLFHGPTTDYQFTPTYKANGFLYYVVTVIAFLALNSWHGFQISLTIYENMPEILKVLNITGIVFCVYLLWQGKMRPQSTENVPKEPLLFEFYRGMEIHPRIWNMDVKQLINCRVSLMGWQILVLSFWFASIENVGWNSGMAVTTLLQTVYIAKFFWWETGYFNTLDITLDRAGFYICWGCLVFLPSVYTYTSYYLVAHQPTLDYTSAGIIFIIGLLSIFLNYLTDHDKEVFKESKGKYSYFSKNPKYIEAEYQTRKGICKTRLLLSGFWGMARHLNYTFELLAALCWCLPGYNKGILSFLYFIFLTCLLVHRVFRDEEKCSKKYGKYWKKYCHLVTYRLLPYVF